MIRHKDYSKYYYFLEKYLFTEVMKSFQEKSYLTPEEFFAIVIWKANRTKTKIKKKLVRNGGEMAETVRNLTEQIQSAAGDEASLRNPKPTQQHIH